MTKSSHLGPGGGQQAFPQALPDSSPNICKFRGPLSQIFLSICCVPGIVSPSRDMALRKKGPPPPHVGCLMCVFVGVLVCGSVCVRLESMRGQG